MVLLVAVRAYRLNNEDFFLLCLYNSNSSRYLADTPMLSRGMSEALRFPSSRPFGSQLQHV